jgi:Hemerythrin HHE cation binding domain
MARPDTPTHPPEEALHMLREDHHRLRKLFQKYGKTISWPIKRRIAEHVFLALELHTQLEETVFYRAFALAADAVGEQLIEDALQDHQMMKDLLAELRESNDAEEFETCFHTLRETVERHMEEEEHELFPQAARALAAHMEEIRDEMHELKQLLLAS